MSKIIFLLHIAVFFIVSGLQSNLYAADSFFDKGIQEFKNENYEEALVFFEKAYKENPNDPAIASYLGLTHREMQNYPEAVKFLKKTLEIEPKAGDVKFLLADVLYSMGNYEEALPVIDKAIEEKIRPAQSHYLKGFILIKLKKGGPAIEAFKKAKEMDASLAQQADFQIAATYVQEREFKKAKEAFKGLITVDPTSDWALFSKDYLAALEKIPPPYRLNIGLGYQYDDNVLTNPIEESLVDITKQEDWKKIYSLFGEYTLFSKGPWNIKTSYSLNIAQHEKSDYPKKDAGEKVFSQDTVSNTFSIMPSYNTEKGITSLLLSYNHLEVDYIRYKQTYSINPSHTFIIKGNHLGQVSLKYKKEEFDREYNKRKFGSYPRQEEDRDAHNFAAGVAYFYTFAKGNGLFNLKAEGDNSDADGANWDYAGIKASTGLLYPFINNRLKANLFFEFYRQDFYNRHTTYRKERRDDTITVQTSLTYTIIDPLDISIGYAHAKDDSNIGVYEYRKNLFTTSLEYRF